MGPRRKLDFDFVGELRERGWWEGEEEMVGREGGKERKEWVRVEVGG